MGGRESQRLIVPSSQGNHPEGTLGREGDASYEPLEGNMYRYTETCHRARSKKGATECAWSANICRWNRGGATGIEVARGGAWEWKCIWIGMSRP